MKPNIHVVSAMEVHLLGILAVYFCYTNANKDTTTVFTKYLKVDVNLTSLRTPT